MQNVKPGTEVVMDESMGKWIPMFEGTPEGVPHLTKIIRKQCGVGIEYKDVADVNTGIILFLEIQEGAELMASKKYCDQYPKHVALTLRLTEFLHGKGHAVYGDSYFASFQTARALLAHGTYFTGLVKNATKGFPKKFLNDVGWSVTAQREDSVGTNNDWWFRCFCTVLGIIEVDAYKVYCCFNQHSLTPSHKKFLDSLVMQLLSNNRQGAPVQTTYTASSRKRSMDQWKKKQRIRRSSAAVKLMMCSL
ncbi:hypothetical protein EMCRGX_G026742 [Ephydatia muelleri]